MTKELPTTRHFKSKLGVAADVQFEYPWLQSRCTLCSRWDHTGTTCGGKVNNIHILQRKQGEKEGEKEVEKGAVDVDSESSSNQQEALNSIIPINGTADLAVIPEANGERSTGSDVRKETEVSGEDQDQPLNDGIYQQSEESVEVEKEWSDVSPTKQARSKEKTNGDSQIISSPSRFAILGEEQDESENVSQEVEEKSEKDQLEVEVENEEGEIVDDQTLAVSDEASDKSKRTAQQKQVIVDEVNTQRISTRNTKVHAKNGAETTT